MKNVERFFGLHFDFHASEISENIGGTTTEADIQAIIDKVKPDFLQCDSKGHPGYSSYPTKVGYPAPSIEKDLLKIWKKVCDENDVALFVHHSGVWDRKALQEHPDWAVIRADGTKSEFSTSLFGGYEDELLIPQLCEIAGDYGIDGVWIDGDCWGIERDFREDAIKAFTEETGITEIPKTKDDKYFKEFNEFFRQKYRAYVKKYVDTLHERYPDFKVISNWAYTTYMPEKVATDVDFMSGDVWGWDNVNKGRFEARFMGLQNVPWDLMSWELALIKNEGTNGDQTGSGDFYSSKPAIQLMQEAAIVLAQGGGFQMYFCQEKDGWVYKDALNTAAEVGKFCKERKDYCFRTETASEIAVLNSGYAGNRLNTSLYAFWNGDLDWIKGIMQCMLDANLSVDTPAEFHDLSKYKMIVIPEWEELDNIEELKAFAENGGSLVVVGKSLKLFEKELGVKLSTKDGESTVVIHDGDRRSTFARKSEIYIPECVTAKPMEYMTIDTRSPREEKYVAATVNNYGKGKVIGIYFNFGAGYLRGKSIGLCDFMKRITNMAIPEPKVSVSGTRYVETVLRKKDGKLLVNLINTAASHADPTAFDFDEIPAVGPVAVKIRADKKPSKITLMPANKELDFTYENGICEVVVEKIEIYDIIVVED